MPTYKVTDPQSGKTVKLTGDSPPTEDELNQIFSSLGGKQSESKPQIERQTLGAITNVPGATSRAAIRSNPALAAAGPLAGGIATLGPLLEAYGLKKSSGNTSEAAKGALNPSDVQTFQDQAIQAGQNSFGGPSTSVAVNFMKGLPGSVAGLAADTLTDPSAVLLNLITGLKTPKIQPISEVVDKPILRAVQPSLKGPSNFGKVDNFKQQARSAVESIVDNKANLQLLDDTGNTVNKLPENLNEFSQAISQTKKTIFNKYDNLAKEAGKEGARIDLRPVADEVLNAVASPQIEDLSPTVQNYGLELAQRLNKRTSYSLPEAQDAIEALNNKLKGYFQNPHPESIHNAVIDSAVRNNLRQSLIKAVEKQKGPEYEVLRKQYGSMNSLEDAVSKAAFKNDKSSTGSLGKILDVISSGDIISGITSFNAGQVAKGTFQLLAKKVYSRMNNPNSVVKKMFNEVDRIKNIDPKKRMLQSLLKKVSVGASTTASEAIN